MGRFITSRFASTCAETGTKIQRNESIYYDGKAYCTSSSRYKRAKEIGQTFAHIQANEEAYFDNFCRDNNI